MNNEDVFHAIVELRGGIPAKCDFCQREFTEDNYPTPEEAGDWACIECVRRWDANDSNLINPAGSSRNDSDIH